MSTLRFVGRRRMENPEGDVGGIWADLTVAPPRTAGDTRSIGRQIATGDYRVGVGARHSIPLIDRRSEGVIDVYEGQLVIHTLGRFRTHHPTATLINCAADPVDAEAGIEVMNGATLHNVTARTLAGDAKGVLQRGGDLVGYECDLSEGRDAFYTTGGRFFWLRSRLQPNDFDGHADPIQMGPDPDDGTFCTHGETFDCALILPTALVNSQGVMNGTFTKYIDHRSHFAGGIHPYNTKRELRGDMPTAEFHDSTLEPGSFLWRNGSDEPFVAPAEVHDIEWMTAS